MVDLGRVAAAIKKACKEEGEVVPEEIKTEKSWCHDKEADNRSGRKGHMNISLKKS